MRWTRGVVVALVAALCCGPARAQFTVPDAAPPTPAELFAQQCGTCHTLDPNEAPRQGPLLRGVYGRPAGTLPGFAYSAGFAKAGFNWDEPHLDAWLTNPQSVIPGAVMPYKQDDADIRKTVIGYLKEQH